MHTNDRTNGCSASAAHLRVAVAVAPHPGALTDPALARAERRSSDTAAANAASSASDQGRRLMVGSSICIHLSRHPYGVRRGTPTATEDQKPQWWSPAGTPKGTAAAPVAPGGTGRGSARARQQPLEARRPPPPPAGGGGGGPPPPPPHKAPVG